MRTSVLLITILLFLFHTNLLGQQGYKIEIDISGSNDSISYLGSYYGDQLTVEDTCFPVKHGKTIFSGDELLPGGIYFYAGQDRKKRFEFIIDKIQRFRLQTNTSDYVRNMKIKGSEENELFYQYQNKSTDLYEQMQELQGALKTAPNDDSLKITREKIRAVNKEIVNYKINFIKEHPDHILSVVFNLLQDPEIPDSIKSQQEKAYRYYKNNYWAKTDLNDARLLRTPVFHTKLEKYFDKIVSKNPDSIINEIDIILGKCKSNQKLFEYLIWHFTATYEQSSIMGYDKIFVHMVDNYFKDKDNNWVSQSIYENLIERADKIRPLIIGQVGPELIMMDTSEAFISSFESQRDYLLIFFWTTTCGECKKEIKTLTEIYKSQPFDIEIYAVNSDTSLSKWKKYLNKYNLTWINVNGTRSISKDYHILYDIYKIPTIYLLDKTKKIIAKHLTADQISDFITKFVKLRKKTEKEQ